MSSEIKREMGMAHGNRGLADYGGLDLNPEGCLGHACDGCRECGGPECKDCGEFEAWCECDLEEE